LNRRLNNSPALLAVKSVKKISERFVVGDGFVVDIVAVAVAVVVVVVVVRDTEALKAVLRGS